MTHCTEEDLILHYYGDADVKTGIDAHLGECAKCSARYGALVDALQLVAVPDVPERGDTYGQEVWQRIRHRLPERHLQWGDWLRWNGVVLTAAASLLLIIGFLVGRVWSPGGAMSEQATMSSGDVAEGTGRRVLLLSVADHLERTDRVLTEVMNAADGRDISIQQEWAQDLLSTSRLYRQDALDADERSIAAVLDELERALLEIVHSPSRASAEQLEDIRLRIDSAALLFKVRILSDELRRDEWLAPADASVVGDRQTS